MYYVTVDSFESEEEQVAFAAWLRTRLKQGVPLLTTKGLSIVDDDGVDHNGPKNTVVINITVTPDDNDGYGF